MRQTVRTDEAAYIVVAAEQRHLRNDARHPAVDRTRSAPSLPPIRHIVPAAEDHAILSFELDILCP
jgi:hypothetical protein